MSLLILIEGVIGLFARKVFIFELRLQSSLPDPIQLCTLIAESPMRMSTQCNLRVGGYKMELGFDFVRVPGIIRIQESYVGLHGLRPACILCSHLGSCKTKYLLNSDSFFGFDNPLG